MNYLRAPLFIVNAAPHKQLLFIIFIMCGVGGPRLKIFIVESEFLNLANIRLIVESYAWGGARYITKSQVRHSTVIITDVNTQGTCVLDASQKQTG